jgi:protein gp37
MSKKVKNILADKTWNPVTGCTKTSPGCLHCYAETMCEWLCKMGQEKYKNGFNVMLHENSLYEPVKWKRSHHVFVCSMADIFHEHVPFSFIDKIIQTIVLTPQHTYQFLTKWAERMSEYFQHRKIPHNLWLGVTVESKITKSRIDIVRTMSSPVRYLCCEPLLEDLGELNLDNINWIIVGGESGADARPMKKEWVLSIEKQTRDSGTAFFFKQWGTWSEDGVKRDRYINGSTIDGKLYQQFP